MKKDIQSLIRMDEETKQLLQSRVKDLGLSESGYIRMLIRQDVGMASGTEHRSGHTKKTMQELYRDIYAPGKYSDVDMKNYDEKKILKMVNELENRDRQFTLERYVEGLTFKEIGQRNGLGLERVRQIIMIALRKIRRRSMPNWDIIENPDLTVGEVTAARRLRAGRNKK